MKDVDPVRIWGCVRLPLPPQNQWNIDFGSAKIAKTYIGSSEITISTDSFAKMDSQTLFKLDIHAQNRYRIL